MNATSKEGDSGKRPKRYMSRAARLRTAATYIDRNLDWANTPQGIKYWRGVYNALYKLAEEMEKEKE